MENTTCNFQLTAAVFGCESGYFFFGLAANRKMHNIWTLGTHSLLEIAKYSISSTLADITDRMMEVQKKLSLYFLFPEKQNKFCVFQTLFKKYKIMFLFIS